MEESFMVISSANWREFDNTRTKFTNRLAQTAKAHSSSVNSLYLAIDQINFDFTPIYYTGLEGVPDIIFDYNIQFVNSGLHKIYIKEKETTLDELISSLHRSSFQFYKKYEGYNSEDPASVTLDVGQGVLKVHERLWHFLNFPKIKRKEDEYYVVNAGESFTSKEPIPMNVKTYNFIDVICNEVEPYYFNGGYTKSVARIDVRNEFGNTIHVDLPQKRYYKLNSSSISELTFEFRHGNGARLKLADGAPSIIKASMKEMSSHKDFFYVQMDSSPSEDYKNNHAAAFTVSLPSEYKLNGRWRVAVSHAEIPTFGELFDHSRKIYSVDKNDELYFILNEVDVPTNSFYRNTEIKYLKKAFKKEDIIEFIAEQFPQLLIMVDEYENYLFYTKSEEKSCTLGMSKDLYNILIRNASDSGLRTVEGEQILENKDSYLYIGEDFLKMCGNRFKEGYRMIEIVHKDSSGLSRKGYFNFSLSEYYDNEEAYKTRNENKKTETSTPSKNWEIKGKKNPKEEKLLLKIAKESHNLTYEEPEIPTWLFMYADFVKPSITANSYSNVLKLIPYKQKQKEDNGLFYTFNPLDWFIVNQEFLSTLRIELRKQDGEIFNFRRPFDKTHITLIFERIE